MRAYYSDAHVRVYCGDALDVLRTLPDESVHACVTSPPYWGSVRDYGNGARQLGTERQPESYVRSMLSMCRRIRRTLAKDGVLWLNVGDVYAASGKGGGGSCGDRTSWGTIAGRTGFRTAPDGYKQKDITLVPFQLAHALRSDGWYLRATIIWHKPAAVEPLRLDRPALSHEYLFLLSRSKHYAVRDPGESWWGQTVWAITPDRSVNHPATMPTELARRCIVCSSKPGDVVLDPFAGSGTTLDVAKHLNREAIGIELNPEYCDLIAERCAQAVLAL